MNDDDRQFVSRLRLGVLHYHWLRCGVTTVVNSALRAVIGYAPCDELEIDVISSDAEQGHVAAMIADLERWAERTRGGRCSIRAVQIDGLAYDGTPAVSRGELFEQAGGLSELLFDRLELERSTVDSPYVLHVHNANLGKNPRLTLAVKLLADRLEEDELPGWILYQMHDFAEDNRPDCWAALGNCSGSRDWQLAVEMMYPASSRVQWATINSADRERLVSIPVPGDRVTVLPNAVDVDTFEAPALWEMSAGQLRELSLR